jgi:PleD family two-component response regulator
MLDGSIATAGALLAAADDALYDAKRSGKDTVRVASARA